MVEANEDNLAEAFLMAMAPEHDPVQEEMAAYATQEGFPIIGRQAGVVLAQLAQLTGATRIFEFGSGFGYSAYWFARGLPDDGTIVLTEEDSEELAQARNFLERGGYGDLARFETGDANEIARRYDGAFDVVLIDHTKEQYLDAFDLIKAQVPTGGVIVADNAMGAGSMDTAALYQSISQTAPVEGLDSMAAGMYRYLHTVREDEAFLTVVLPVGSGLAVSVRQRD